jgi:hypothetical protein
MKMIAVKTKTTKAHEAKLVEIGPPRLPNCAGMNSFDGKLVAACPDRAGLSL